MNNTKKSNVSVLPSLSESFSIVLLEAMTCGCPVICSDLPGHSSIVNKDCGIICQKEMSKYSDRRLFICLRVAEYERKRKKIYQKIAHGIKLVSKSRRFI